LVARPAFAKCSWSLIDDQPSHRNDVDPERADRCK
jgi:hypothetical protein